MTQPAPPHAGNARRLRAIVALHTLVWLFFSACIVAMPIASWHGAHGWFLLLAGVVAAEVVVLLANGRRCPLTSLAARCTSDRRPNFDIWLPAWLARHNQVLCGTLYALGLLSGLLCWLTAGR